MSRHYIFAVNAYFIYLAVNRSDCSTSYIQLNLWINCIVFPFSSEDLKLDNEIFSEITFVKFVQNLLFSILLKEKQWEDIFSSLRTIPDTFS